ncbi:MAG TPA: hypothetical protein VF403_11260 [Kofleriaceae bacterium]
MRLRARARSTNDASVVWCEIVEEGEAGKDGVFLFSLDVELVACFGDGWALTVDEAKSQAAYQFEIDPDGWHEVLPSDVQSRGTNNAK